MLYHRRMVATEKPASSAVSPGSGEIRILVVDNDKSHAQAMAETLDRVGYDCTVATSGPEGAQRIDQDDFDVVITDLVMNEVAGEAILRRAKETLPDCEVIVVTGTPPCPRPSRRCSRARITFLRNR